ncbi:hypothetical protein DCM91_18025 [Chitinophaga costaii]|nr:hypothetical protein DCM91_18025 [Chitinophaga costaii]
MASFRTEILFIYKLCNAFAFYGKGSAKFFIKASISKFFIPSEIVVTFAADNALCERITRKHITI